MREDPNSLRQTKEEKKLKAKKNDSDGEEINFLQHDT